MTDTDGDRADRRQATERDSDLRRALQISEDRLAEVQRLAKIGTWEQDLITNTLWWSDTVYHMLELEPERHGALYEDFLGLVHPEDREAVRRAYAESVIRRTPYEIAHRLQMPGGAVKYVNERGRTLYDEQGRAVRSVGTMQDITDRVLAEQQAMAHERRFRSLIEHSSDLIAVLDSDARVSFINTGFGKLLGFRMDEWLGRSVFELIWPEDLSRTEALFARSRNLPGEVIPWQLRVRHADGTLRWLEGTGTNRLADPAVHGFVVNCRDITERMQTEEALRQSEELLRQAIRVSDIGIFDHDHRTDTIYWSPRQREIHGWGPTEPVTLADFARLVHPDDAAWIAAAVQRAHDPAGNGAWDVEHRIVRRDGSVRWLIARSQTFFAGEGAARRPIRTVGAVVDDTERKNAEEALRLKDQAIATALNGIAITNGEGRIVYVNPAFLRLWGYESEAEVLGRAPQEFAEFGPTLQVLELIQTGGSYQGELVARRKDGTTFDILLSANVMRDAAGQVINMMGSFLDISEAKRLQAQLLHAQKMESVGRLAGGVAHDFNNLLTVMKGNLDLALTGLDPGVPRYRNLSQTNNAVDSAAMLTQQLLAFSRKQIIRPETLNLNDVVRRVQKMLPRLLGEDIELLSFPAPDLGPVRFDNGQCEQILVNLAVNARDAMPLGGRLTLETANVAFDEAYAREHPGMAPGDYVMLAVSDTGSGMTDEVKAHLFEPFFTTKGPGRGTGLGLAMVYGGVSQNGGRIEVYSEPGHGTSFKIYLPRVPAADVIPEVAALAPLPRGTETIILVEDNDDVRSLASQVLAEQGYRVHAFRDGESTVRGVGEMVEPLHLLLTDVVMPGMNGRELAGRLKEFRPALAILFTSGYTDNVIVRHGVLAEGVEFLPKPYSVDSLARTVRRVLDRPA